MINGYADLPEPETVRFERVLAASIDRVWAFLTDSELRGRWLASGPMELREGGALELRFRHADLSSVQETVPERYSAMKDGHTLAGRITRCEPPRVLAYTWGEGGSEVTFELAPEGEGVRLVLTHRRLAPTMLLSVASGWHAHLDLMQDVLEGREPAGFWSTVENRRSAYETRLGLEA